MSDRDRIQLSTPGVAVPIGVMNDVIVGTCVAVLMGESVGVFVGVLVGVFVGVLDGVFVGVLVGVLDGVFVGVLVGVFVGVLVGVLVGVFVGVLVAVLVGMIPSNPFNAGRACGFMEGWLAISPEVTMAKTTTRKIIGNNRCMIIVERLFNQRLDSL